MNHPEGEKKPKKAVFRSRIFLTMIIGAIILYLSVLLPEATGVKININANGATLNIFFANLLVFAALMVVFNTYVLEDAIHKFQNKVLPWIMSHYENLLNWSLKGWRPVHLLLGTVGLLILSVAIFFISYNDGERC